jgi:hypothetical protein
MKRAKVEIKIEPHSNNMSYYCIYYRFKKKFNFFNTWKQLVEVWDGAYLCYDQPVLFSNFDNAVKYGEQLKKNPNLIKEHYKKEDKKYQDAEKRRSDYYNSRNKTVVL